ncbi:MAG: beta-propeller domain-containing protein, partial [Polyangiales bacterium]
MNAVQLSPVLSCEALEAELETVAQAELGAQLEALRQPSLRGGTADVALAAPTGVASAEANQAQGAGLDYSGTNNQERGVDEADIVKSDGQHLYVLSGGHLLVLRSHPATELAELSRLPVPGRPLEMFVHGDRALIFSELTPAELPPELPARSTGGAVDIAVPALACAPGSRCGFGGLPQTQLTLVDLSDRGAPRLLRENIVEARYLSSRRVGASVRVVVRGSTYMPVLDLEPQLDFDWYDDDKLSKRERRQLEAEIDRLESEGRARIQAHALADWLPRRLDIDHAGGGTRQVDSIAPCVRFFRDEGSQGRDVLDVITVNLDKDNAAPAHAAILGHGAEVYASTESLYIASHPWSSFAPWWGWQSEAWLEERTHVHRFDIALDPDQAVYVASGSVPGHLPGNGQTGEAQFAMDEADGRLRIATTTQGRGTAAPEGWQSENHLFILELGEGQLRQVGSVEGLAPGEQIFAARFVGNRGYLVTFRQVDPLFVFD